MSTKKPTLRVDFNEMLEPNLVLLSAADTSQDLQGDSITLYEGLEINVYMYDLDNGGTQDNLVAKGVVERNSYEAAWGSNVKWCCRINDDGVRHSSEI